MLFHTPDGVGETAVCGVCGVCGVCVAISEGEIDSVPAETAEPAVSAVSAVDAGEGLGPAPTQPARPTATRVISAAPAHRIRIRLDFVFMPYSNWSTWQERGSLRRRPLRKSDTRLLGNSS